MSEKLKVIGHYVLKENIGKGAMGSVWLSTHPRLNLPVAIKVLDKQLAAESTDYVQQFIEEGRTAAALNHSNIVRVYDADHDQGFHYLVMEYIDGCNIRQLADQKGGSLTSSEVLELAIKMSEALREAQAAGIVHRDIKPDNIMVTSSGQLKLADLGIAKRSNGDNGHIDDDYIIGTPHYISPEQSLNSDKVDHRSDIYSLGATMYHLLTGIVAFDDTCPKAVMMKHVQEPLGHPKHLNAMLPDNICAVVCKMMEKNPLNRYQSYDELLEDLNKIKYGNADVSDLSASMSFDTLAKSIKKSKISIKAKSAKNELIGKQPRKASGQPQKTVNEKPQSKAKRAAGSEKRKGLTHGQNKALALSCLAVTIFAAVLYSFFREPSGVEESKLVVKEERQTKTVDYAAKPEDVVKLGTEGAGGDGSLDKMGPSQGDADEPPSIINRTRLVGKKSSYYPMTISKIDTGEYDPRRPEELLKGTWNIYANIYVNGRKKSRFYHINDRDRDTGYTIADVGVDKAGKPFVIFKKGDEDSVTVYASNKRIASATYFIFFNELDAKTYKAYIGKEFFLMDKKGNKEKYKLESFDLASRTAKLIDYKAKKSVKLSLETKQNGIQESSAEVAKSERAIEITKPPIAPNAVIPLVVKDKGLVFGTIKMMPIKAGSFMMGFETGRSLEKPVHKVTLSKDFWMGQYEVTQKQWQAIMASNPSHFKGENLPVEQVNGDDCQEFITKLNLKYAPKLPQGYKFSLPTEGQWEYACRAGTTGIYSGSGNLDDMGWHMANSVRKTHAVGQKKANAWGLYDMHGNVWEMCKGWFGDYPSSAIVDPQGAASGSEVVSRGGAYNSPASRGHCRSTFRAPHARSRRVFSTGLRLALVASHKPTTLEGVSTATSTPVMTIVDAHSMEKSHTSGSSSTLLKYQGIYKKSADKFQKVLTEQKSINSQAIYTELKQVEQAYKKAGNLDRLVALREFLKKHSASSLLQLKSSTLPGVKAALVKLAKANNKSLQQYNLSLTQLQKSYKSALQKQVIALTKANKIDEAVILNAEIGKLTLDVPQVIDQPTTSQKKSEISRIVPSVEIELSTVKLSRCSLGTHKNLGEHINFGSDSGMSFEISNGSNRDSHFVLKVKYALDSRARFLNLNINGQTPQKIIFKGLGGLHDWDHVAWHKIPITLKPGLNKLTFNAPFDGPNIYKIEAAMAR